MVPGRKVRGFSLIELIVVMVITGVLMAIAMPAFIGIIKNSRLATETNDLLADLALARSEAATRGRRVAICLSSNGTSCGSGSSWGGGRIVFVDGSTAGVVDSGDTVIRYHQGGTSTNNVVITASGFTVSSSSTLNHLQYRPSGATGSDAGGQFKICDDRTGNYGRIVVIGVTGRAALSSSNASCP